MFNPLGLDNHDTQPGCFQANHSLPARLHLQRIETRVGERRPDGGRRDDFQVSIPPGYIGR